MAATNAFFPTYFANLANKICKVESAVLLSAATVFQEVVRDGGKIILAGNGGSAAMASHLSVDLTKAARLRALNCNEADLITCFANDYGYEQWIARALESYADRRDAVVLISSSGKSPNILNGAARAREMGLRLVTLSGFKPDNPLRQLGNVNFWCDSEAYNVVEMTHHVWLLAVVDYLSKQETRE